MSTLYDMYINIKNGFVADDAAVYELINMAGVAGIAASVDTHFVQTKNITRKISAGSRVIFLMVHH